MSLKDEKRNCVLCQKEYIPKYKPQKYCSRHCSMLIRGKEKTLNKTLELSCGWCKKQFVRRKSAQGKSESFCSIHCSQAFKRGHEEKYINKICSVCDVEFKCLYRKPKRYCTKSCSRKGTNNPRYGKPGTMSGKMPWTKGLTKSSDERIAEIAKKVSQTHKQQFAYGIRNNAGCNNPNYGKTIKDRTPEQLLRYSEAAGKRILNGLIKIRGIYVSNKTGKTYKYRSSFEKRFILCLEKDSEVLHYDLEPFAITYVDKNGRSRKYVPDFYICYKTGKKSLIEIKSDYTENVYNFSEKKKYALEWCKERNIDFFVYKEKEIIDYEKRFENE